jgi:hypothetical protein
VILLGRIFTKLAQVLNNICESTIWFDSTNNIKFFLPRVSPSMGPIFLMWLLLNNKILFLLPVMSRTDYIFLDPCPKQTWVCWLAFTTSVFITLNLLHSLITASYADNLWHLDFEFFGLHHLSELFCSLTLLLTFLVFSAPICSLAISSPCSRCVILSSCCFECL